MNRLDGNVLLADLTVTLLTILLVGSDLLDRSSVESRLARIDSLEGRFDVGPGWTGGFHWRLVGRVAAAWSKRGRR